MYFCSPSFQSVLVGTFWAQWRQVLMTPSSCSSGWWELLRRCWSVWVVFPSILMFRLPFPSISTPQSKKARQLNHHGWIWCFRLQCSMKALTYNVLILTHVSSAYLCQWPPNSQSELMKPFGWEMKCLHGTETVQLLWFNSQNFLISCFSFAMVVFLQSRLEA